MLVIMGGLATRADVGLDKVHGGLRLLTRFTGSTITVAGIVGYARNDSRIRRSTAFTIEPFQTR